MWQTGILGLGSYFFLVILAPYLTKFDTLHLVSSEEKLTMQKALWGFFSKAKRWPDHPIRFMLSYTMKGVAFLTLFGVLAALLTSVGWRIPLTLDSIRYDLIFARAANELNSAHLASYLPIPAVGLWVAWKFRTGDGMPNSYLGLIVSVFGVVIHEGLYIVGYYLFYPPQTWALIYNVMADLFFVVMLGIFLLMYMRFPMQKIPLRTYFWPTIGMAAFFGIWALLGYHISTVNNFIIGHTQFNISQWYYDPLTNALEVGSWNWMYLLMGLAIRKVRP